MFNATIFFPSWPRSTMCVSGTVCIATATGIVGALKPLQNLLSAAGFPLESALLASRRLYLDLNIDYHLSKA